MDDNSQTRQERIIEWLAQSEIAISLRSGAGFYVDKGSVVKLKNGNEVEALDWLEREGLKHGKTISGYDIKHREAKDDFSEKLFFFEGGRKVTDAPF